MNIGYRVGVGTGTDADIDSVGEAKQVRVTRLQRIGEPIKAEFLGAHSRQPDGRCKVVPGTAVDLEPCTVGDLVPQLFQAFIVKVRVHGADFDLDAGAASVECRLAFLQRLFHA